MFVKKKYCLVYLTYNTTIEYFLLMLLSLVQVNVYTYIFFNTNTGLMIKKINKKYLLTSINDKKSSIKSIHWPVLMIKKVNKKYTLTSTNDKKRSIKKCTLTSINDKKDQ